MAAGRRHVTLADVAREAGVSVGAVSLVLNNGGRSTIKVGGETAAKIQAAAAKMRYIPNAAAQSLVSRRTFNIGYILADHVGSGWANEYFGDYLNGVERACRELGYKLVISRCDLETAKKFAFSETMPERNIDGLVAIGEFAPQVADFYQGLGVPVVLLNYSGLATRHVVVDTKRHAMESAWDYALALGHRRILSLFAAYPGNFDPLRREIEAEAERVGKESGAVITPLVPERGTYWDGSMGEHLHHAWSSAPEGERATFLCGGDELPEMLATSFLPRGVKVPEDLSVLLSFDYSLCAKSYPRLSAIHRDNEAEGHEAVRLIVEHLDQGKPLASSLLEDQDIHQIIERDSTRRLT